jgi:hypothetical protein
MLAAAIGSILLVTGGAQRAFGLALAVLVAAAITWILVSVFWPATPNRTCPECGRAALRRSDPSTTRGVECAQCGATDPDRSSFLLAEEEDGPLELPPRPSHVLERGRSR